MNSVADVFDRCCAVIVPATFDCCVTVQFCLIGPRSTRGAKSLVEDIARSWPLDYFSNYVRLFRHRPVLSVRSA